jgi:hypothetical protein
MSAIPQRRPRYNQKGRAASIQQAADAGQHNKRKREYDVDDSNAEILDPEQRKKRRAEVRDQLGTFPGASQGWLKAGSGTGDAEGDVFVQVVGAGGAACRLGQAGVDTALTL